MIMVLEGRILQGFLPRCIHSSCSHESLKKIPLRKVSNTTNQNHAREPKLERDDRRRGIESWQQGGDHMRHEMNIQLRLNQRGIHLYIVAKVQVLAHIHTSIGKGKEQKKSGRNTSPNETELKTPKELPLRLDATSVMTPRGETLR